jgi:uncharacterized DUF497 family protein
MASLARASELEILAFVETKRGGERGIQAFGLIDGEYYSLAFVFRPNAVRAISLRRAHRKEIDRYVPPQK